MLIILIIVSWALFIVSVLLMSPKWWIGFGIWGVSTSNEYGSKKSVENTLKKVAFVSIFIFLLSVLIYPYANRGNIVKRQTNDTQGTGQLQNLQETLKVDWQDSTSGSTTSTSGDTSTITTWTTTPTE